MSVTVPDRGSGLRPEIQGLRAVAALLVVLFHLWPGTFSGGYVGVDVFFVISGFLITSHLLREVESRRRIDFAAFWARRARRLLPGALTVIALSAIGTWLWVPQRSWQQFFGEHLAATLYVENWALARAAVDYLAEDDAASPVQHYWTLSVEEQFYLVWPLLIAGALWLATRRRWRPRIVIATTLAAVVLASLVHALDLVADGRPQAYFATTTRAWEFGAGALLAFVPTLDTRLPRVLRGVLSWTALVAMIGAGFVFDAGTPVPGWPIVVLVLAAVVFIAAGSPSGAASPMWLMRTRPVQATGDISYALYLWHWPLIVLLPYARSQDNGPLTLTGILVLTFVLAWLSTRFVEDPVRHSAALRRRKPRWTYGVTIVAMAAVAVPCFVALNASQEAEQRDLRVAANVADDPPACFGAASRDPRRPCDNDELASLRVPEPRNAAGDIAVGNECASRPAGEPVVPCRVGDWDDPDTLKVAIIGDSHARMYSTAFRALAAEGKVAFDGYFQSGCLWTDAPPVRTRYVQECISFKEKVRDIAADRIDDYDLVVTAGRTSKLDGSVDTKVDNLLREWSAATDRGVPVVAMSDSPDSDNTMTTCLEEHADSSRCSYDPDAVLGDPDPLLAAADRGTRTHAVDLRRFYCDTDRCPGVIGGATVYYDSNHFTATFTRTLAPYIWRDLQAQGLTRRR